MSSTPRQRTSGASITDVARLAGVSAQTVSRVSTGAERVRPDTRERVLTAMKQLGYSPNRVARALRSGTFNTIGLIAHRSGRTGEALTTEAVVTAAEAANHSVTLLNIGNTEANTWETAAGRLSDQAIDGLIIIRAEGATPDAIALPPNLPVAVSDSRLIGRYPGVIADQIQGSCDAVNHLFNLGHREIHHISGPPDSDPANIRRMSWERALAEVGIRAPAPWEGDWTPASGYAIGRQIALDRSITAVYCSNDEMAFGLMRALHEAGRRVPDDVSIIGFDDIALSEYTSPPLTTVKQDFQRLGRELVKLVLDQIHADSDEPMSRVLIPTELIIRNTTAPPPSIPQ